MEQLKQTLEQLMEKAGGMWALVVDDLDRQTQWAHNEEELFYAASVIKIPIMAAVFAAAARGNLRLSDRVTLMREDIVGGAGVLQHMTPGIQLPIVDLLTLMIIQSDNTATNVLIDAVGKPFIRETMRELGMSRSEFHHKLMIVPAKTKGYNVITAADMSCLLARLAHGKFLSRHACEQMIAILKKQQFRDCLPAHLPEHNPPYISVLPTWELAHKTGWVTGIRHDVGIFYVGNRCMTVALLSRDVDDFVARQTMAAVGRHIYEYLRTYS
ncbi:serine hydrolase [Numidum massiliense]|uniref:serine hydrolase n=1 Tax=Numidum massiliense TaxID=1522315 RepID=UPI000A4FC19A|nr:serine hydrolase [Numidum massiliense]